MVDSNWTVKLTNFVTEEIIADKLRHNEIRLVGEKSSKKKKKNKKDKDENEKEEDEDSDADFDNMVEARSITDKSMDSQKIF